MQPLEFHHLPASTADNIPSWNKPVSMINYKLLIIKKISNGPMWLWNWDPFIPFWTMLFKWNQHHKPIVKRKKKTKQNNNRYLGGKLLGESELSKRLCAQDYTIKSICNLSEWVCPKECKTYLTKGRKLFLLQLKKVPVKCQSTLK